MEVAAIRTYLIDELDLDLDGVGDEDLLLTSGVMDSFGMLDLMVFIEKQAGKKVKPGDVTLENFDSISRISAFSQRLSAQ